MKKYFHLAISLILLISCDTNPTSTQTDEQEIDVTINNLAGTWSWVESLDSLNEVVDAPTSTNANSLEIYSDYTFNEFKYETLFINDKFSIYRTVLPNTIDSVSVLDWETSKYFNYIVYSLTSKYLVVGIPINKIKKKYSRLE